MTDRPTRYPQVAATPGGNFAEPLSGVQLGGWPVGAIFPSSDANWLFRQITDWNRDHDARRLAGTDLLSATAVWRASATPLAIAAGPGLVGTITTGGVYYGAGGQRLDLTNAPTVYSGGNALVFPPSFVSLVIARPQPPTGGAANGSSTAELKVHTGAVPAGWAVIMQVTTNATNIVSAAEDGAVTTTAQIGAKVNFAANVSADALATFRGQTQVTMNTAFPALIIDQQGTGTGIQVYSGANHAGGLIDVIDGGLALSLQSVHGQALKAIGGDNLNLPAIGIQSGAGRALEAAASPTFAGSVVQVSGGASTTYALEAGDFGGVAANFGGLRGKGRGAGAGVRAESGSGAGAVAVDALATNSTGAAVSALTHSTATNAARAGYFEGRDQAAGVEAVSPNYYPLILTPDATSPQHGGALFGVQNAKPVQVTSGGIAYLSGTWNTFAVASFQDSTWRVLHSSPDGYVYGSSLNVTGSNSNSAVYSTHTTVALSNGNAPKAAGQVVKILVALRARLAVSGTPGGIDIRVRDTTAGATVIEFLGTGVSGLSGFYIPGATTRMEINPTFEVEYAVPAAGARTFALEIKTQTATSIGTYGGLSIVSAS